MLVLKTSIQLKLQAELENKLEKFVDNLRTLRETHHFPDTMIVNMDAVPPTGFLDFSIIFSILGVISVVYSKLHI